MGRLCTVKKVEVRGEYHVICAVCGRLASYVQYWRAAHDAKQHEDNHDASEREAATT